MHDFVALDTLLALLLFFWMILRVGKARARCGVAAPATTGDPEFERHFRVQMNTLEGLVLFLPALWLFAIFVNEDVAAALGLIWLIGRVVYMFDYVKDPSKRSRGFITQMLATLVLMLGALGFVIWDIISEFAKVGGG